MLAKFYEKMFQIRHIELEISNKYKEQKMRCPVHLSVGQEAIATGVCLALNKKDEIISTHRSHGHYIAKGGDINSFLAELYGKKTGCARGIGGSMHIQDIKAGMIASIPILASALPIGVGIALKNKLENNNKVVVIFFGDGAMEEGAFYESINFASLHKLKILFICENNFYSVYASLEKRTSNKRNLKKLVNGCGIKSQSFEGNDVTKVFQVTKKSLSFIKNKNIPFLIEFKTYRWLEHCGPNFDNHLGYRSKKEVNKWVRKDPLKIFKNKMKKNKVSINFKQIEAKVKKSTIQSFLYAEKSPKPGLEEIKIFEKSLL
jgi:TPP-dependent pyruvate/acetoin dehydrogenase alpha subunit